MGEIDIDVDVDLDSYLPQSRGRIQKVDPP